ncbi:hypothetical protein [Fulvivirga sedimenti]|uniref:CBM6 domain-containing protein n=1 Tax=Fulvivirga sedimenti TaxID=2879465 RepID=A0A9X1HNI1_9BACT|nr:hypothetical protein [Fulvivirga sedimenti]MCA6074831.1 hypothetical protein [Fulvivirga sedimenti]MCA6076008.1 hypothetical protein [Fulvivirga sedimenti]MCA6077136.1 hypothetical protein [Fulvivirga sedimenti]
MNSLIKSIPALLLCFGLLLTIDSCNNSEDPDPVANNGNNGGNSGGTDGGNDGSDIEGCQYPIHDILTDGSYTIEQGDFKALGDHTGVYTVFGYTFTIAYDGELKEIGIQVPENGNYQVRLYRSDLSDNTVLAETTVSANNADWHYNTVTGVPLSAEDEYLIAIYFAAKPEELETYFFSIQDFSYPVTSGDVTIESYAFNTFRGDLEKPEPKDPDLFKLFNGLVDFCFEAN